MSTPQTLAGRQPAPSTDGARLTPLAGHWIESARIALSQDAPLVRVTVVALRGSAPREPGASMLVGAALAMGTIGGGQLEWHATALARELLRDPDSAPVRLEDLLLGPELGQCCGGRVQLWLERMTRADLPWLDEAARRMHEGRGVTLATEVIGTRVAHRLLTAMPGAAGLRLRRLTAATVSLKETVTARRPRLWIFGAGHVGQALVRSLAELALFDITWIDSRAELLPADLAAGVNARASAQPAGLVASAPAGTQFVVMTHDHALDYRLCQTILSRGDARWLGLIGSASKAARFRSRLVRDGLDRGRLPELTCPIGVLGIKSKQPAAIAIAIAAQLLQMNSHGAHSGVAASAGLAAGGETGACGEACGACGTARSAPP